jgi:hypothetical protein
MVANKGSYEMAYELNTSGVFVVIVGFTVVCHIIRKYFQEYVRNHYFRFSRGMILRLE